ncbi:protein of unknown function [Magnetospirillum sp. XM-1]|uniref:hypothetical protein n=1 Tax=Magnetospirillum sp. XM-1 TaxID=1663591 RepID=UPI00073DEDD8|nr:hypothetical protein [Magnetospirillum sp. XM-1]CUW40068.1 protein of unknown function [Magnetospirillum sp. XM-1]
MSSDGDLYSGKDVRQGVLEARRNTPVARNDWSDLFAEINQAKFDISSPSDDDGLGLTDENMFGG